MNLREAKALVRRHDTGTCSKFYQTSRSTWVCLSIKIGSYTWRGLGKALYNPNDAKDRRLQWNAGKGYNIARGRAVADIARQIAELPDADRFERAAIHGLRWDALLKGLPEHIIGVRVI